jgi:hypothetical protein
MSNAELLAILKEIRETAAEEARTGPQSCPNDGELLEYHPGKGVLHCKFCGWTAPGVAQTE